MRSKMNIRIRPIQNLVRKIEIAQAALDHRNELLSRLNNSKGYWVTIHPSVSEQYQKALSKIAQWKREVNKG
jgi:CHASE3 domain sensor protein